MLLDICCMLMGQDNTDVTELFSQYELCVLNHDYTPFIKYAVEHNKVGMLDKLLKYDYYGTLEVIGVTESDKYCAKKLMSMLKN